MSDSEQSSRRSFLKTAVVAGVSLAAGSSGCATTPTTGGGGGPAGAKPKGAPAYVKLPGQKLRLAFIGTGGIGGYHLDSTKEMDIVCPCFCDVDSNRQQKAAELYPGAARYQDYREMFDKEHANFDAVMIGVPDHHHYPATMMAMKLGKHVYTQKPLTHTPWEARQLLKAADEYKVVTQMGNQGHANLGWRLIYEWYHSGVLGDIHEVHTWTDRPIWPQGMDRPEGEDPVPSNLNWDCWVGPAPLRPYKGPEDGKGAGPYHWFNWRGWWDFGCGALGDMACHTMDGMFWALDPGYPTAVEPLAATPITADACPKSSIVKWEFPKKGKRPAFVAYWYDGGLKPPFPPDLEYGRDLPGTGNLFLGTKASVLASGDYGDSVRIIPETKMKDIAAAFKAKTGDTAPPQLLERSPGHIDEWMMACKGEKPIDFPKSRFAYSAPMTETISLGNIALRVGRRLEYDGPNMRFTNVPEANQYITKEYRDGWKV